MELTHVLTGYWDLYIVTENLGSFDNMACACDTHPSAFTKQKLGWLDSSAVATHTGQAHSYDLHTLGLVQAGRPERFFAGFAHGAFPQEMHHAQNLQKIFPVAEGDHAPRIILLS